MKAFPDQALPTIITYLRARWAEGEARASVRVLDPDSGAGRYAGEPVQVGAQVFIHRPLATWVELAGRLGARLRTPRRVEEPWVELDFELLDPAARWQAEARGREGEREGGDDPRERYGAGSGFQRISKIEQPGLLLDLDEALGRAGLQDSAATVDGRPPRILALGVNSGEELELLAHLRPSWFEGQIRADCVGIDYSASAIEVAEARLGAPNMHFVVADLDDLSRDPALREGPLAAPFDLILVLGTLQSPTVSDRALLQHLVKERLNPFGVLVIGVPNCRYLDGELVYGGRMKNYREVELGLVIKDVAFYRRYLQQHKRRVLVTGKHYLLVTAVRERS